MPAWHAAETVKQIFWNLAASVSYCLFPSQIMNWHRVRQGTVTVKNVSLIAFFRSSEDGHTRRDHATNVNERQRTSTNVNERQRTSTNVNERQRTSTNVNARAGSLNLPRKFPCFLLILRRFSR